MFFKNPFLLSAVLSLAAVAGSNSFHAKVILQGVSTIYEAWGRYMHAGAAVSKCKSIIDVYCTPYVLLSKYTAIYIYVCAEFLEENITPRSLYNNSS